MVLGRGTRLFAIAIAALGIVLIGPSAPSGALIAKPLPADAAQGIVPNRVLTWNICNPCGSGQNMGRAAEIATYAPQVFGLQEACVRDVEKIRDYLEVFYGLVYEVEYGSVLRNWNRCGGLPWHGGGFGQAILSAAPMSDPVNVEYPDGGTEDRGYLAVTTKVGGRSVRVFNTHFAERRQPEIRAGQARVLADEVARHDHTIVLGDFNAVPDAAELRPLWALAKDADPACRPFPDGGACEPTTDWQSKFDYIFLRGIAPLTHQVRPSPYSDHHPLHAEIDPAW
ncbi:endonuclease/exonuclease/phosphatase family protein [Streptomyces sp. SGAir0957]